MITIPLSKQGKNTGKYSTTISHEDADLAEFRWHVRGLIRNTALYARRMITTVPNKQTVELLHRVILSRKLGRPLDNKEQVDHINMDGLDNRRENLRLATPSQNKMNTGTQNNNTSGYRGVHFHKKARKWHAQININKKRIHIGVFNTPEEAHAAYCEAAKEHFGEFANNG